MRRALFLLVAVSVVAGLTGCIQDQMCCRPCGQGTTCMLPGSCASLLREFVLGHVHDLFLALLGNRREFRTLGGGLLRHL